MTRERTLYVAVAAFVLASGAAVGFAITNGQTYTTGATLQTDSGLSVTIGYTTEIESGNPFTASDEVVLRGVRFRADGGEITLDANTSAWTNVSAVGASTHTITVDAGNKPVIRLSEDIQQARLSENVSTTDDGRVEAVVEATSTSNFTVDLNGQGAVAVDADSGQAIDEGTVNPDGTVTFEIPSGTHRIDFQSAPSTLFVFQERNPEQLIDGNAELRVRFFEQNSDEVIQRTVTDGTVDLSGFPSDERFVVTVSAEGTDYAYRRIVVESLSEQQSVYLLNTSATPYVNVSFELTDYTGEFPGSNTTLIIEKPITKDFDNDGTDETRYRTILGDNFGSSGSFPAVLAQNERYRLRLVNGPNRRILGAYTAAANGVEQIRIQDIQIDRSVIDPWLTTASDHVTNGQRELDIRYMDESEETQRLNVTIHERGNASNVVFSDTVTNAPIQNYTVYNIPVQNETSYVVNWTIERGNQTINDRTLVGGGGINIDIPLPDNWLGTFGFVFIAFIGSLAGARKDHIISVVVVAMAGIMMGLQVVAIAVPLWWAAALIALGGYFAQQQEGQ